MAGLPEGYSLSSARIYDHLSPRMQVVLFQAKKKLKKSATINIAGRRVPLCACNYKKTLHLDNQAKVHGGPRRN